MAKALYGHLVRPPADLRLHEEIARLRERVRELEAQNAELRAAFIAPDDLASLDDLNPLEILDANIEGADPAFA